MSVYREAAMDRLPVDSVKLLNFTLNWENFVRNTVGLSEIKHFNRALWLSLDDVVVLNS